MLMALNAGCSGLATIHANSGRDALEKLVSYGVLAGDNVAIDFLRRTVASVIDLVVFLKRSASHRHVAEILRVPDQHDPDVFTTETLFQWNGSSLQWAGVGGRGVQPRDVSG